MTKFDVFAEEVLGQEAWGVLKKSVAADLHPVIAPRLVLGWLRQNMDDHGLPMTKVPGTEITVGVREREPDLMPMAKGIINTAARICAELGCEPSLTKVSPVQTGRLGKAVDALLARRAKVIGKAKADELEKVDEPGKMAAPWGPKEPEAPTPQKKKQGSGPLKPSQPPKLTRSEAVTYRQLQQPCPRCGQPQLAGGELRGCLCTARMLKNERVFFGARGAEMILAGADDVVSEILASIPE